MKRILKPGDSLRIDGINEPCTLYDIEGHGCIVVETASGKYYRVQGLAITSKGETL